jgi:hypothetical protein
MQMKAGGTVRTKQARVACFLQILLKRWTTNHHYDPEEQDHLLSKPELALLANH